MNIVVNIFNNLVIWYYQENYSIQRIKLFKINKVTCLLTSVLGMGLK